MLRGLAIAVVLLCLVVPVAAQNARPVASDEFSFYGLKFGTVREEIKTLRRTNADATEVIEPGHGMVSLNLGYDFLGRLTEIRASYERPSEKLHEIALRQALRERFLLPIPQRWRNVGVDLDEYYNKAALTLVLVSTDLRQEALDLFKNQYLKGME